MSHPYGDPPPHYEVWRSYPWSPWDDLVLSTDNEDKITELVAVDRRPDFLHVYEFRTSGDWDDGNSHWLCSGQEWLQKHGAKRVEP